MHNSSAAMEINAQKIDNISKAEKRYIYSSRAADVPHMQIYTRRYVRECREIRQMYTTSSDLGLCIYALEDAAFFSRV